MIYLIFLITLEPPPFLSLVNSVCSYMAPTLTLTPDIFNNPTQIKTKCITSNKTELLKPFLLPLPMCVLCDLFMLLSVDSFIFVCSGLQPFTFLSPRLLPIFLLKPFFPTCLLPPFLPSLHVTRT